MMPKYRLMLIRLTVLLTINCEILLPYWVLQLIDPGGPLLRISSGAPWIRSVPGVRVPMGQLG